MSPPEAIESTAEEQAGGAFIEQIPTILRDRRWWIISPTILGAIGALITVLVIPDQYRSKAVMLVQSPQLPGSIIGSDNGEVIDRRIARIRQEITSRPNLVALIERHGLYSDERKSDPLSEVVEQMREAIVLSPTEVPTNRNDQRTIAFELAFDYYEPAQAQAVAQDLVDRVVELDATGNAEQANSTVQFLNDQAKALQAQIAQLQGELAEINARNGGILGNNNMGGMAGGVGNYDYQIAALQRDNANLVQQRNVVKSSDTRDPVVVGAETQLAAARAIYADTHPDVIIAKQRLAEARELAKSNIQKLPVETIDEQIAFNNSQIANLRASRAQDMAQISARLSAQAQAPLVMQQIGVLQQKISALNLQHDGVQAKLMSAQAGVRAEDEQMGERLAVVDPPMIPDTPVWPDRLLIAALGIGGGLALGLFLAFAFELFVRPIRDPGTLAALAGEPPMAVVPVIKPRPRPGGLANRFAYWQSLPGRLAFWRRAH